MARPTIHLNNQRGFTLFEVVLVVVIIGIILSLASLTLPDNSPTTRAARETERLFQLMRLASEEAIVHDRVTGVRFAADGYAFYYHRGKSWHAEAEDGALRPRRLDDDLRTELLLEGRDIKRQDAERVGPDLLFWPTGELAAFTVRVRPEQRRFKPAVEIVASPVGGLQLQTIAGDR